MNSRVSIRSGCIAPSSRPSRPFHQARRRNINVVSKAAAEDTRGVSGIDVAGNRPTSPRAWEIMSTALRKSNLKFIDADTMTKAQKSNKCVVVDIRPAGEYSEACIPGAINVEFFRLIEGWDVRRIARRATFAFFGILNGTEANDRFLDEFQASVPNKNTIVVLYCNIGGSLEAYGPSEYGQQTRGLTAAYELVNAGYKNVQILKGGYNDWTKEERLIEVPK